jgi:EmrB/QacA subfamily drug resistance transporter
MIENITAENKKSIWESPYYVMVVLMLGVFMMALDMYVFAPALPIIVKGFNTSYDWVAWTMTIYMLISTAVMPLGGKLSDVFGRKRLYMFGILCFTIGSFACSLSWDIYSLILFRGLQAIGGGIIIPAALSAMGSVAPPDKQGKTMGVLMAMSALAMIIGPNIGGYIIQNFGWRWVFYINIPIGVLSILLALKFHESYGNEKHHIDIIGAALIGVSLASLLLGLVRLETMALTDINVFPLFVASAVLLVLLFLYERRTKEPILDIPLLAKGEVLSLNLAMLVTSLGLTAGMLFVPTFAQTVLHMNIQDSGTILTPMSVSLLVFAIMGGVLLDKLGAKPMLIIGSLVAIVAMYALAYYVTDQTSLAIVLVLMGAGFGLGMGAFQVLMLALTPGAEKGTSSAILNTFKGVGGTIGPVIGGFFLTNASNKMYTISQAFNYIFLFATAMGVLALVFLVYLALAGRHKAVVLPAQVNE